MTSLKELADLIDGDVEGDPGLEIKGVSDIKKSTEGSISLYHDKRYRKYLGETKASALVVSKKEKVDKFDLIRVENPLLAFTKVIAFFTPVDEKEDGIHPTAILAENVKIGKNVIVGPWTILEKDVELMNEVVVGAHCYIGSDSTIGNCSSLFSNVILYEKIILGKNVLIHSGTVLGADGFGFVTENDEHAKIPHTGGVEIRDNVEIGANCAVDRGTFGNTVVGEGSKLDDFVHVGHNAQIGKGCLIAGKVGIAGSSVIGDYSVFGGQAGVVDHVEIGERSKVGAQSGITKSMPGNQTYSGMPARELHQKIKVDALVNKLPEIVKRLKDLEETVTKLKENK